MKNALLFGLLSLTTLVTINSFSQASPEPFAIEIEPLTISSVPGIHSYSWGKTSDGKWVVVGGRIDGLHQRQPFAAFLEDDNNKLVFVIDPVSEQSWFADLSILNSGLFEQLQSTNQEFYQRDSTLYIIGGYGFSPTNNDHITYPNLTAIDLDGLASAVISSTSITPFFRQITDTNLKVTGGQLGYIDSTFYLVGGQLFDGAYNPMGPNHGPGFTQEYTNAIREFKINDDGVNLVIYDYVETVDTVNLHRRDYNMSKQIFPNGSIGFTAFSGVFNYNDMPFLDVVDIVNGGYTVNPSFNQYLSQYHSAKIPIYDSTAEAMHTLFFGGMSQFYLDVNNNLVEDVEVPFVKTVSRVTRLNDGSMQEVAFNYLEMPALLGSGAEFIPSGEYLIDKELVDINAIPTTKTLIGYIYGGIESSSENIFFINDGSQSTASNTIFKVYVNKSIVGMEEYVLNTDHAISDKIYPNPAGKRVFVEYAVPVKTVVTMELYDINGQLVKNLGNEEMSEGMYTSEIDISDLSKGQYFIKLFNGSFFAVYKFVKK